VVAEIPLNSLSKFSAPLLYDPGAIIVLVDRYAAFHGIIALREGGMPIMLKPSSTG